MSGNDYVNDGNGDELTAQVSTSSSSSRKLVRKLSEQYDFKIMSTVDEFVQKLGGNRVIKTVRINNNYYLSMSILTKIDYEVLIFDQCIFNTLF